MARRSDPLLEVRKHGRLLRVRRRRATRYGRKHPGGRWDSKAERVVLGYLLRRDRSRCGRCGKRFRRRSKKKIDHVAPTDFGLFDLEDSPRGLKAVEGEAWESKEHLPDNLQAVHTDHRKRSTPLVAKWRHPECKPLLPVAVRRAGLGQPHLWVPREPDPQ